MAHHIAPSVPIIIHIFSYGKVNILKKNVISQMSTIRLKLQIFATGRTNV